MVQRQQERYGGERVVIEFEEYESDRDFQFLPNFRSIEGSLCLERRATGYEYLPPVCNLSRGHEGNHRNSAGIYNYGLLEEWAA